MVSSFLRKLPYSAKGKRKEPVSMNPYLKTLHAFFKKIVHESGENAHIVIRQITKRLATTRRQKVPMKVSEIANLLGTSGKVAVLVGKVLDDETVLEIPPIKVVALKWSRTAEKKIIDNGGSIYTLDQFLKVSGGLDNIMLVKGDPTKRKASKYFGLAPGEKKSTTLPRILRKCKNAERPLNVPKPPMTFDEE